jgi:D-alanyl-D-alanine dipeptidase
VQAKPVWEYTRATLVRASVADMLNRAIGALPSGVRLGIIEGWRPAYIQRRMWLTSWLRFKKLHPDWSDHQLKRIVNRFVAPPNAPVPPPHSTGGAVDVVLLDSNGRQLDMSSPYELYDPKGYAADVRGLDASSAENRRVLREVMGASGLTNYPSEWWHWSYGDQGWAYRSGKEPFALYGRILQPKGWDPIPEDDVEEALVRLTTSDPQSGFPKVKGMPRRQS